MALPMYNTYYPERGNTGYGGGLIPEDIQLKRLEVTRPTIDPYLTESFLRATLLDTRPDPAFLASDLKRDPNDSGSLGFMSKQRLNLRHEGALCTESPWLSDGLFLDFIGGGTDRDPRGHAVGPDFTKYDSQRFARSSFIRMFSDEDFSIPSEGIAPPQMVKNKKSLMPMFKDRYQNFEESMDGWTQASTGLTQRKNYSANLFRQDGVITDLTDSQVANRTDAVSKLSADPTVAFRHSTPDHRFKIGRYGQVRANQFLSNTDAWNNRNSSYVDHRLPREINGQLVNRMLANLIVDLQGQRDTKEIVAQGAPYGDSAVRQMQHRKLYADDVYKILQTIGSAPASAQEANYGDPSARITRLIPQSAEERRQGMANTHTVHEMVESMAQATTKQAARETSDLRDEIARSAADLAHNIEHQTGRTTAAPLARSSDFGVRDSELLHDMPAGYSVANYAQAKPVAQPPAYQNAGHEAYKDESRQGMRRNNRERPHAAHDTRHADDDQEHAEFGTYDAAPHARADKHADERQTNDVHDIQFDNSRGVVENQTMLQLPVWLSTAFASIKGKPRA